MIRALQEHAITAATGTLDLTVLPLTTASPRFRGRQRVNRLGCRQVFAEIPYAEPSQTGKMETTPTVKEDHGRSTAGRVHSTGRGTHTAGQRTNADGVDPHQYLVDRFRFH